MKIIVYAWGSECEPGLIRSIRKSGDECIVFSAKLKDYHMDSDFSNKLINLLHTAPGRDTDMIVSYDYFPLVSMICEINQIPYISWVYDCPLHPLYSKTVRNHHNYFFCFDKNQISELQNRGCSRVFYLPLGTDVDYFQNIIRQNITQKQCYENEISFVGSLYEKDSGKLQKDKISLYNQGYLQGVMEAQLKVYGYNFIRNVITQSQISEVTVSEGIDFGEWYEEDRAQIFTDVVGKEASARERVEVLRLLASRWKLTLFSNSALPQTLSDLGIQKKGYIDYYTQMPLVFHESKINLNITLKTIESGIPQRVLDILACGGFCLTNYQQGIAEEFTDGKELVMYTSMADLADKARYYLEHEEERKGIARAGQNKICHEFSMITQWDKIKGFMEKELSV